MSQVIDEAVTRLNERTGGSFDGTAKFVIEGEGNVMLDEAGARAADEPAEVTLTADPETFRAMMDGEVDPTGAYMSGRLKIEGDMGQAMKLAQSL